MTANNASGTTVTISAPVNVGSNQTWQVTNPGAVLDIKGALTGNDTLVFAGAGTNQAGTLILDGTNNNGFTVNAGTLLVNSNNSSSTNYTIGQNKAGQSGDVIATLGGNGSLGGHASINDDGIISPGACLARREPELSTLQTLPSRARPLLC